MFFVYVGGTSAVIMSISFSIAMYLNKEFPKHYTYIFILYTVVNFTISIMGLVGLASNRSLMVVTQKIGAFTALICFIIIGYGAWKLEKS
jgi:hypothetical protein